MGLLFLLFIGSFSSVSAQERTVKPVRKPHQLKSDKILVKYKSPPMGRDYIEARSTVPGSERVETIPGSNVVVYRVQPAGKAAAISALSRDGDIELVAEDATMYALDVTSDDTLLTEQWALSSLKITSADGNNAWDTFDTNTNILEKTSGVTVALIDSGIKRNHPDLSGNILLSLDCRNAGPCQGEGDDLDGHGTDMAGIISAATNNSRDVAGSAYGAKIISLAVLGAGGQGDLGLTVKALQWVAANASAYHIKVVNMSLGGSGLSQSTINLLQGAVDEVWQAGVFIVAAAGNSGDQGNPVTYPAALNHVFSIAALKKDNTLATYSEYNDAANGNWIDAAAPGGECDSWETRLFCIVSTSKDYTTGADYEYEYGAGTSQASAFVSGLSALAYASNSSLTNSQMQSILETTSDAAVVPGKTIYGGINALAVVQMAAANPPTVTVQPSVTVTPGVSLAPTNTVIPSVTITASTPTPAPTAVSAFPTTGPAVLPKISPNPYPGEPYCPDTSSCGQKRSGDGNCDGIVNYPDYTIWTRQYDIFSTPWAAPFNDNANYQCVAGNRTTYFIDLVDFEAWRRHTVSFQEGGPVSTPSGSFLSPTSTASSSGMTLR